MIRVGYACINSRLVAPNRTCRLKNASSENIRALVSTNLAALQAVLEWNVAHDVRLFRITSDVIPFGSHQINKVRWQDEFKADLASLGNYIRENRLRVSMHPGQFTVLNSPRPDVLASSVRELEYHSEFLDALGVNDAHKIIIHLGGTYDDKRSSMARFIAAWKSLDRRVRARVVIENDERCYSLADALSVSEAIDAPVVFDVFHHGWLPSFKERSLRSIIELSATTWHRRDGRPKIHYSNQWPGMPAGTHSKSISVEKFRKFYPVIKDMDLDVMLEVKDKERSVLKLKKFYPV